MIATSTEVDGTMAGQFASLLMDLIHQHESEAAYTLDVAKFDAVKALSETFLEQTLRVSCTNFQFNRK